MPETPRRPLVAAPKAELVARLEAIKECRAAVSDPETVRMSAVRDLVTEDVPWLVEQLEQAWARAATISNLGDELVGLINSLRTTLDEKQQEVEGLRAFQRSVHEALNSGDGVYRP